MSRRLSIFAVCAVAALVVVLLTVGGAGDGPDGDAAPAAALAPVTVGARIDVGGSPSAIVVGAGAVWVVDAGRSTLTRVDPQAAAPTSRPTGLDGGPFAVAVGEGAIWVAATDGTVRAFDPGSGEVTGPVARVPGASGLAVGAGGVWVTSRIAGTVTRVDPQTRRADAPIGVGAGPADVAVGAGAVWVANAQGGSVSRIDPRTGTADAPIGVGAPEIRALAVDDDGAWVTRAGGPLRDALEVVRIDPDDRELDDEDPVAVSGSVPVDMITAGDSVWVTDVGALPGATGDGALVRVGRRGDRRAGRPLDVGLRPSAVAAGSGALWVANAGDGTIREVVLSPPR